MLIRASILILLCSVMLRAQQSVQKPSPQNPSPMVEHTRKHERLEDRNYDGRIRFIDGLFQKPAEVFLPEKSVHANECELLIHFHGASYPVEYAAQEYPGNMVAATVNLGSGSSVYGAAFSDSTVFAALLDSVESSLSLLAGHKMGVTNVSLSGFSAGYGAIRKILSTSNNWDLVDGVLLLDGIHASYMPERVVLAEGGRIDSTQLEVFLELAREASRPASQKQFLITHSEIFPGTFVSTTEATDYLLEQLGLARTPVLQWGPLGMQQLSTAGEGHFRILGFAGNSARDHVDHFQGMYHFLRILRTL